MPPTSPARCRTMSGFASLYTRTTFAHSTRSYSLRRGTNMSAGEFSLSLRTTLDPRKPEPPVTSTRLPSQKFMARSNCSVGSFGLGLQIGIDHNADEFGELYLWTPIQLLAGFRRIAHEHIDLRRPVV